MATQPPIDPWQYEADPAEASRPPVRRVVGSLIVLIALAVLFGALHTPVVREALFSMLITSIDDGSRQTFDQPTVEVTAFANRLLLTEEGREVFFSAGPIVRAAPQYEVDCRTFGSDDTGCYSDGRIVIFERRDPRLDGMMEVTAAHELLHAAWERMTSDERAFLEPSIRAAFATIPDMESTIAGYLDYYGVTSVDNPQMLDEMHSFVGTDVVPVDPALEAHYSRFFADRPSVVALNDVSRLAQLRARFDQINARMGELNAAADALGARIEAGAVADYSTAVTEFNANVTEQNALIAEFDLGRAEVDDLLALLNPQTVRGAPPSVPAGPGETVAP